jgi:hypothetical protein
VRALFTLAMSAGTFQGTMPMDFIERWFGFAPDHGDGSLEAIILLALVTLVTGLGLGFFRRHHDVRK